MITDARLKSALTCDEELLACWLRRNDLGTKPIDPTRELHRRIARGYRNRNNYRLRMLLIAGGLNL